MADLKLLLNLNGADEATSTTDESPSNHSITFEETAQLDTAQKQFGSSSLLLDGNSDYLTIPDSDDWNLLENDNDNWTVDLWVKHTDHVGFEAYFTQYEDGTHVMGLYHHHSTGVVFFGHDGDLTILTSAGEITDFDWHHIALIKVANRIGIYLDGVNVLADGLIPNMTFTGALEIGRRDRNIGGPINHFFGNIDGIRISKSNVFGADPTDGGDTITVPTSEINYHSVAGGIDGQSVITGAVRVTRDVSGSFNVQSTITGAVKVTRTISGSFAGVSSFSGDAGIIKYIAGSFAGVFAFIGTLSRLWEPKSDVTSASWASPSESTESSWREPSKTNDVNWTGV